MLFHKLAATVFGIGYLGKGVGTVAAFFGCICWYLLWHNTTPAAPAIALTLAVTVLGIWSGNKVEPLWGKDHGRVVIDEVAGMFLTLLFIPVTIPYIITGFVLFRFFDIAKPLLIRKLEALPGGWGVMADDLLAGVYANILLQVIIRLILPNVKF
ncbi:phosphatidylglycerophosphatase A [Mucilaginibacter sp. UR6-11]|uniref:phosphatidylglycerophosphatase A family protein n=1 Tax=Mucilaginibacter sp. UR6-11 TaxID=1435644 RepID=UPI001E462B57|nr:phosphatidylglycerophosphatase A [Mucilaginibacter sp. UR6-11]MCC8426237.1 phosphatidylglycerophosphatase A [Mucilaginibacter sp. UR6-11]